MIYTLEDMTNSHPFLEYFQKKNCSFLISIVSESFEIYFLLLAILIVFQDMNKQLRFSPTPLPSFSPL